METKVERLKSVVQVKDREIATVTRIVQSRDLPKFYDFSLFNIEQGSSFPHEAKGKAAFKAQIDKLQ